MCVCVCVCEQVLTLDNPRGLVYHTTQPTKQRTHQIVIRALLLRRFIFGHKKIHILMTLTPKRNMSIRLLKLLIPFSENEQNSKSLHS